MPRTDPTDNPPNAPADPDLEAVVARMPEAPEFAAARQLARALDPDAARGAPGIVDAEIEALWQETARLQRRIQGSSGRGGPEHAAGPEPQRLPEMWAGDGRRRSRAPAVRRRVAAMLAVAAGLGLVAALLLLR